MTPTRPNARGYFGPWGGRFVPETLMAPLAALERAYRAALRDRRFRDEFDRLLGLYAGRPTPLYPAERLSARLALRLYLKREDLLHTGAHKINNTIGQALLARRMGKTRLIAETGAGQHGVATATVAARFGMACTVYMGTVDMARQRPNVERMRLLGAEVVGVDSGSRTLKDAINEALRDWVAHSRTTHYVLGSVLGPAPYPEMIRTFHRAIGREARRQILAVEGRLPDLLVACVGGGSNAAGLFYDFLKDRRVKMVGVEAGGVGDALGRHAARFTAAGGAPGVLHGTRTVLLQDAAGNVAETRSVSAGLDYPAVGPEHALWRDLRRVSYERVRDREALDAFRLLGETEGILPALESAHAVAYVVREARRLRGRLVVVNLSGRGDKDLETVLGRRGP